MNAIADILRETIWEDDFNPEALKEKYLLERDKRLREDANDQYIEVTGDYSNYVDAPYVDITERAPLFDEVECAIIGGGFGGKARLMPEEIVVCAIALETGKPNRWLEDRREH